MSLSTLPGSSRGFTLLELLAAIAMTAMVLSLASLSLGLFQGYSSDSGEPFEAEVSQLLKLNRLADMLESASDYFVTDFKDAPVLLFEGESDSIRFVSQVDWVADRYSSYNTLVIEDSSQSVAGSKSLVLYTIPLTDVLLLNLQNLPEPTEMRREVILEDVMEVSFEYLGLSSLRELLLEGSGKNPWVDLRWSNRYEGTKTGFLPHKVAILVEQSDVSTRYLAEVQTVNPSKRDLVL